MFRNNDEKLFKYISTMKSLTIVFSVFFGILSLILIFLGLNTAGGYVMAIEGVILLILAISLPIITFVQINFIAMLSYDLKAVRNKLYGDNIDWLNRILGYQDMYNVYDKQNNIQNQNGLSDEQFNQLIEKIKEYNNNKED